MAYGTIKVDNITFDNGGVDKLITVSGLFYSTSGALTVTGTISGGNVTAPTATFTTLTGTTTAGTSATFTSGSFTSLTGVTTTGTTANFVSGVFTTQISGVTITGTTVAATTGNYTSLTGVTTTGTTANFVTFNGASGVFTTRVSGATITGTTANFTSGNFIALSGTTTTVTSGVFSAGSATAPSVAVGTGTSNSPGIYSPGTDQLAISTSGSGRLFVNAAGLFDISNTTSDKLTLSYPGFGIGTFGVDSTGSLLFKADEANTQANSLIQFKIDGGEKARIDTSGNLGIGVTPSVSYGKELSISADVTSGVGGLGVRNFATGNNAVYLSNNAKNTGAFADSYWTTAPASKYQQNQGIHSWYTAASGTAGNTISFTQAMTLDASGNLGVGNSSPSSYGKFVVTGSVASSGLEAWIQNTTDTGGDNTRYAGISFSIGSDYGTAAIRAYRTNSSTDYSTALTFWTKGSGAGATTPTERMRIDSSGRVGIGAIPATQLDIQAGSTASASFGLRIAAGTNASDYCARFNNVVGTPLVTINGLGNVGIGTTGPTDTNSYGTTLDIRGSGTGNGGVVYLRNSDASVTGFIAAYGDGRMDLGTSTNHPLKFITNNSEKARIDSFGRLLVGTSTDQGTATLQIQGDSASATNWGKVFLRRGQAIGTIGGNVGSRLGQLDFGNQDGAVGATIMADSDATWGSGDYPTRLVFSTTADGAASPTERMRIRNDGKILMGTTAPVGTDLALLNIDSPAAIATNSPLTTLTAALGFWNPNGRIGYIGVSGTTTFYGTSSDYRLKENINPVLNAITRLQQLKPSRFNFISDPSHTVDGFIAHEAQEVVPECALGEKDAVDDNGNPVYQGIDQSKLVPLLTAALQEAIAKIEALETRLSAAGIA